MLPCRVFVLEKVFREGKGGLGEGGECFFFPSYKHIILVGSEHHYKQKTERNVPGIGRY